MLEAIKKRWLRYNPRFGLTALSQGNYGERLRDYPLKVAIKMLAARLALILPVSVLLPDRRLLLDHHGTKIYLELINHGVTPFDLALGVYEYRITKLLHDLIKEGMTIVDIGAFEGDHSILFAHWMHDKGKILAFEPEPDNCRWFRRNMEVNNYKCIDLYECALSDREGTATFYPGTGVGSLVFRPWWNSGLIEPITVRTQTLDNILNQAHIDKVDLIKIDVEGCDVSVLKGAERTLRNNNVHLIIDVDVISNAERTELYELLTSFGYQMYSIGKQLELIQSANELLLFRAHSEVHRPTTTIRQVYAVKRNAKVIDLVKKIRNENEMLIMDDEAYQIFMAVVRTKKVDGDIAEVGVYRGASAKLICEAKGDKALHLFDTFEGLPDLSKIDDPKMFHRGQFLSTFEDVKNYLKEYPNVHFYKGLFPSSAEPVEGKMFSFVNLDVDLYESTLSCLKFFYPRMNKGGVIMSHDYMNAPGVAKAFDDFFEDKQETIIVLSGSQCLIVKQSSPVKSISLILHRILHLTNSDERSH